MVRRIQGIGIIIFIASLFIVPLADAKVGIQRNDRLQEMKSVAIFPFADFARRDSFVDALKWENRQKVLEEIKRILMENNIEVAPESLVAMMLQNAGVIKKVRYADQYGSPEYEAFHTAYRPIMVEVLFKKIKPRQENTTALTREKIKALGESLKVDTIIRGAILHYELQPFYKNPFEGIMPMPYQEGGHTKIGYAFTDQYDCDLWNFKQLIPKHDFNMILPAGERTAAGIIFLMYGQDVQTGEIFWKGWFELPYPTLTFGKNLTRFSELIMKKTAFERNNKGTLRYGYLYDNPVGREDVASQKDAKSVKQEVTKQQEKESDQDTSFAKNEFEE